MNSIQAHRVFWIAGKKIMRHVEGQQGKKKRKKKKSNVMISTLLYLCIDRT